MMMKIYNKSQRTFVSTHKERELPKCFDYIANMNETKKKLARERLAKKINLRVVYCIFNVWYGNWLTQIPCSIYLSFSEGLRLTKACFVCYLPFTSCLKVKSSTWKNLF